MSYWLYVSGGIHVVNVYNTRDCWEGGFTVCAPIVRMEGFPIVIDSSQLRIVA